jgi:hypothetical protein
MNRWKRIAVSVIVACFFVPSITQAQGRTAGALGGAADALQDISRSLLNAELQRQLMLEQHNLEMQRLEREHEMRMQELRDQEAAKERSARQGEARQAERQKVEAAHPGWVALVRTDDFRNWLSGQPASVKELTASDRAEDAIIILNLFKLDRRN